MGDAGIEPATLPVCRANDTRVSSRHSARLTHESEADPSGRREAPLADEFLSRPRFFDCSRAWPYSWRRTLAQRWPQASPSLRQQPSLNCWMFMSPQKRLDVGSDKVRFAEVVERLGGRVDLVVVFCAGKPISSRMYSSSQGALRGRTTRPLSNRSLQACRRITLSAPGGGLYSTTFQTPSF